MDRIDKICSYLGKCRTFADVGCDHGYCAEYMLKNGLCERATVTDISQGSLSKAEKLLKRYIEDGRCISKCCFGLDGVDKDTGLVLIAGMGGEEIISILDRAYIPERFVLQPMHNVGKVRRYLVSAGAEITCDDVFICDGKYYFVLCGKRDGIKSAYTEAEFEFGKGANAVRNQYITEEIQKKREYLGRNPGKDARKKIEEYIKLAKEALGSEN